MIEARGLTKRYGDKAVVTDLTLLGPATHDDRIARPERRRQVRHYPVDPRAGRANLRLRQFARFNRVDASLNGYNLAQLAIGTLGALAVSPGPAMLSPWVGMAVFAGWVAVALGFSAYLLTSRDV